MHTLKKPDLSLLLLILLQIYFSSCGSKQNQSEQTAYLQDTLVIRQGQELFNQYCASCHGFTENNIGPSLHDVVEKESHDWLASFIKNAPQMIESGDERAVELREMYSMTMPAFTMLTDEHIEALLAYINSQQNEREVKKPLAGGLRNPVSKPVLASGLTLVLEEYLTIPASAENPPLARINKMSSAQTSKGERLFIHDLRGKVYEIKGDTFQVFLDMKALEPKFIDHPGMGTGLGSIAFHPEFKKNGIFYTTHTEPKNTASADFALADSIPVVLQYVLSERKMDDPTDATYQGSSRELLRAEMYSGIHGFQDINFNPTAKPGDADYGMLYMGIGDGGATMGGYPEVCELDQIWGKVIRIDPAGKNSKNGNYGIPKDNPWADGKDGALPEIWVYGFRNPHRIAWDQSGDHVFITDIGQHCVEELNLGKAGANYGWPNREGTFVFSLKGDPNYVYPLPPNDPEMYTYASAQYDHSEGNAIMGGFVYERSDMPLLKGKYIFGDIVTGKLYFVENDSLKIDQQSEIHSLGVQFEGKSTDLRTMNNNAKVSLRFGMDGKGQLYILTKSDGKVYKVTDCIKNNAQASSSESTATLSLR